MRGGGQNVRFLANKSLYLTPVHEVIRERHPRKSRYFTVVGLSFVKTVADRHGHSAYHNKH